MGKVCSRCRCSRCCRRVDASVRSRSSDATYRSSQASHPQSSALKKSVADSRGTLLTFADSPSEHNIELGNATDRQASSALMSLEVSDQTPLEPSLSDNPSVRIATDSQLVSHIEIGIPVASERDIGTHSMKFQSQVSATQRANGSPSNMASSPSMQNVKSPSHLYVSTTSSNAYGQTKSMQSNSSFADNNEDEKEQQESERSPGTAKSSKWKLLRTAYRIGAAVTDVEFGRLAPLADDEVECKKLSLDKLTTFRSQLTNDAVPQLRIRDWDRKTDRNICHVYRLCEEFQRFGYGQSDELGQNISAVDFAQGRMQIIPENTVALSSAVTKNVRAEHVLEQCGFFQHFNTSVPGFIASIAAQAVFTAEAAGQVIFRQNDIVGNVYVLVSGEVSVHTHSDKQLKQLAKEHYHSPRPKDCPKAQTLTAVRFNLSPKKANKRRGSTASVGSCSSAILERQNSRDSFSSTRSVQINETTRFLTVEGFSTFCQKSNLGNCIGNKEAGTVFGEKGAMAEEKRRNASVKCVTDCELLTIMGADYKAALKHVKEKMKYFEDHVPGAKATKGGAHGSTFFTEAKFSKGHFFLTEGISGQPVIYVIKKGAVEFRRCEDPLADPAREFRHGPHTLTKTLAEDEYAMLTYARLSNRDIFCSLSAFPVQAYEPFSAIVATDECTVYFCTSLHRLSEKMLYAIRHTAMHGLEKRLLPLKEKLPDAFTLPFEKFHQRMETAFDWSLQEGGKRLSKRDSTRSSQQQSPKRDSLQQPSPKSDGSQQRVKINDSPTDKRRKRPPVIE